MRIRNTLETGQLTTNMRQRMYQLSRYPKMQVKVDRLSTLPPISIINYF